MRGNSLKLYAAVAAGCGEARLLTGDAEANVAVCDAVDAEVCMPLGEPFDRGICGRDMRSVFRQKFRDEPLGKASAIFFVAEGDGRK